MYFGKYTMYLKNTQHVSKQCFTCALEIYIVYQKMQTCIKKRISIKTDKNNNNNKENQERNNENQTMTKKEKQKNK